jgi:hypothetical protein
MVPSVKQCLLLTSQSSSAKHLSTLSALFPHQFGIVITLPLEKAMNLDPELAMY